MNWRHLRAFLWLRWRLRVNQVRRGGIVNAVILALLAASAIPAAVLLFALAVAVGLLALPRVSPLVLMLIWDGIVLTFLTCWSIGLVSDLQRTEALSLGRFLHLPVSLAGAFVINYVSALLSFNLLLFVPILLGLSVGATIGQGPAMAVLFPLVAALLFAVTAVTYQFQGWLASLMSNPRRRRTIVVLVTVGFLLVVQLPNLLNLFKPWQLGHERTLAAEQAQAQAELQRAFAAGGMTPAEFQRRQTQMQGEYRARRAQAEQEAMQQARTTSRLLNLVLPIGWLPYGAAAAAEGDVLPGALGALGLTLIGTASLWRAYRTTVRLYTGQFDAGPRRPIAAAPAAAARAVPGRPTRTTLLEWRLPWLSEPAAAIALGGFRALWRAPEVKMVLLSPLLVLLVLSGVLLGHDVAPPVLLRPLIALGAAALTYLMLAQLTTNQFGFDRAGFRVFVLGPAPRRDVLLGKNLALALLALPQACAMVTVVAAVAPMRADQLAAVLVETPALFLQYVLPANLLSILAPYPVAPGSMKPANPRGLPVLIHALLAFLFPLLMAPAFVPFGIDYLLDWLGWLPGVPVGLLLAVLEVAAVAAAYPRVLGWQGRLLQLREQKILEVVAARPEGS